MEAENKEVEIKFKEWEASFNATQQMNAKKIKDL